jgi:tetratricopeptide (TPR) repeat protein
LNDIVARKPDNMEVVEKLAETLLQLKRYDEAAQEYKKLVAYKPDNYYYHLKLGEAYQRQKKYNAADEEFQAARRLAPEKALPLYYMVDLNIVRGKYGAAESLAKQALEIEPTNLYPYLLLGDIYARRGIIGRNQWVKNKSTNNCNILNNAMSHMRTGISNYTKAKPDPQCTQYCNNEIKRLSNFIDELEEDKWFYCKGGSQ